MFANFCIIVYNNHRKGGDFVLTFVILSFNHLKIQIIKIQ